jgi:hypothetical protein
MKHHKVIEIAFQNAVPDVTHNTSEISYLILIREMVTISCEIYTTPTDTL